LYIADPDFLKEMTSGVMGKSWGKPRVFKHDREPMFGNGLVMAEGDEWVRHRHVITPAFSPANLKVHLYHLSLFINPVTTNSMCVNQIVSMVNFVERMHPNSWHRLFTN